MVWEMWCLGDSILSFNTHPLWRVKKSLQRQGEWGNWPGAHELILCSHKAPSTWGKWLQGAGLWEFQFPWPSEQTLGGG